HPVACTSVEGGSSEKRKLSVLLEADAVAQSSEKKQRLDVSRKHKSWPQLVRKLSRDATVGIHDEIKAETVLSKNESDESEVEVALTVVEHVAPVVIEMTNSSSTSGSQNGPIRSLKKIVDAIFPEDSEDKAILEHGLLTCQRFRENFVVSRFLGSGCSGLVMAATRASDGREVAVKMIPHVSDHVEKNIQRELDIMLRSQGHENVLALTEYFTTPLEGNLDASGQPNEGMTFVVMGMASYDLFTFLDLHKQTVDPLARANGTKSSQLLSASAVLPSTFPSAVPDEHVKSIFTQAARGLSSLHAKNIVHGDIKDENILVRADHLKNSYSVKLCDFGFSRHHPPGAAPDRSMYGTIAYVPPEMDDNVKSRQIADVLGQKCDPSTLDLFTGYEADIWALGLCLYALVHGDIPAQVAQAEQNMYEANRLKR
ncbi:hypothetical protein BGZ46_005633, partial [Entomortierella lignicola]